VHAEVRTRVVFEGVARSAEDAVDKRQRMGRLEAIEAIPGRGGMDWEGRGVEVKVPLRCSVMPRWFEKRWRLAKSG
jgi:hypothetical protein